MQEKKTPAIVVMISVLLPKVIVMIYFVNASSAKMCEFHPIQSLVMWSKVHNEQVMLVMHYVYPCQRFSTGNTLEDYNP
jgi:hypothetical protein